ncbi:MAG: M1 family metallopeptidase [Bacteroidota bacterium]
MRYLLLFLFLPFFVSAQQTDTVDFQRIEARVFLEPKEKKVMGECSVKFAMKKDANEVYLDAINMTLLPSTEEPIEITASDKKIVFLGSFKKDSVYTVKLYYQAYPKQALYFANDEIWTQGQGKYTSHWLPSIDDMNDKIEFDLTLSTKDYKTVVSNGKALGDRFLNETNDMTFDMQQPMSSYLVAFVMGNFEVKELRSNSEVPIFLYYRPEDSLKVEPTYRYTKEIFDFLETEIGVAYPWQNYKQIPVRDFLYAGMENTTATIFSEAFVVDSIGFNDRNYVNVNAHEMAHQWFGNLVTETEGTHHWLHEGFATYYALLAEKEVFGEDYYYWKLFNTAEQLTALSDEGRGQSLLDPKASSLIFYEKGAWALHILKELIGEEAFKKAIVNYLNKYEFKNVTTQDFLTEIRAATSVSIDEWEKDWLKQTAFKSEQAYESLKRSEFIQGLFSVIALRKVSLKEKYDYLEAVLDSGNEYIASEVIYQLALERMHDVKELLVKAFEKEDIYVRQALAQSFEAPIPAAIQKDYESLLDDPSYLTQEIALLQLWSSFPEKRVLYLDKLNGVHGFQDKNVKLLWLVLSIYTEDYKVSARPILVKELRGYTRPEFGHEIRQKAFGYINSMGLYDDEVIDNLINGSVHHYWRFRDFCRELLTEVLKNPGVEETIMKNLSSYSTKEQEYIQRVTKG